MSANIRLFECKDVKKQIGDFILSGINFSVKPGYVTGVIGRNGAGKTTLSRLIMGSSISDYGEIFLNGASAKRDIKPYKKQLAYVLNETPFPVLMTSHECGMVYGSYYDGFDYGRYLDLLKKYGVPLRQKIKTLSKGQQIRQQLAFALSYDASLYIFDEPAANLDVEFRDEFYGIIREITSCGNKSVIYVSHLVDELEQVADYILWISKGRQKYFGTLDSLRESYQLAQMSRDDIAHVTGAEIVGSREREMHKEILIKADRKDLPDSVVRYCRFATLKEIMYYEEKGDGADETDI